MKNQNGYTLIELLGVIVLLAIISSIAVIGVVSFSESKKNGYYQELEESLLLSGSEFYAYNKKDAPLIFGDEKQVSLSYLNNNNYTEGEIKDTKGQLCNLNKSYVAAYKNSLDKTNYYVCLMCDDYKTNNLACFKDLDYTLTIKANNQKVTTNAIGTNKVVLNFQTLNDMDKVIIKNFEGNTNTCDLKDTNGVKSCSLEVKKSGNYYIYGQTKENNSLQKEINVLIK